MKGASNRKKGETFAKLPFELLTHPSVTTLSHPAYRVLTIFAAGYRGNNNGNIECTKEWVKQFGIASNDVFYTARRELLERGLIEITRQGMKYRQMPTLYAITWQSINHRDGEILGRFSPPPHTYLNWSPKELKPKKFRGSGKSSVRRTDIDESVGRTSYSPSDGTKGRVSQSVRRHQSRISVGFTGRSGSDLPPDPAPNGGRSNSRSARQRA